MRLGELLAKVAESDGLMPDVHPGCDGRRGAPQPPVTDQAIRIVVVSAPAIVLTDVDRPDLKQQCGDWSVVE